MTGVHNHLTEPVHHPLRTQFKPTLCSPRFYRSPLAAKVKQSVASVRPSVRPFVCFHSLLNRLAYEVYVMTPASLRLKVLGQGRVGFEYSTFYCHVISCALARRGVRLGAAEANVSGESIQRVWAW